MEKLLKLLSKIEDHFNKILIKIIDKLFLIIANLIPASIKKLNKKCKFAITVTIGNIKFTIKDTIKKIIEFVQKHKNDFLSYLKHKSIEIFEDIKKTFVQTNFGLLKKKFIRKCIYPIRRKIVNFFNAIKKHPIVTISIITFVTFVSTTTYIKINNYYGAIDKAEDEKAYASKNARPDYFNGDQRLSSIIRLMLPIYVETAIGTKSLYLDIVLESSNRLIVLYIEKFQYMIIDHLIVTISPLMSTWPLQEEGKKIVLDKIKDEINALLKEKKIRGKITKVYIDWLLEG
ncbi:MAG: hypothetical protein HQK51_08830 [Oligoflexia bacterium]|nr:hypothetical protein [Oligoflexia bacterium]